MGCDWYTGDRGGQLIVEIHVENERGHLTTEDCVVDVPPEAVVHVDEHGTGGLHER